MSGKGKIVIDEKIVPEYLELTGQKEIERMRLNIKYMKNIFPVERINMPLNR